jgi:hypothetical protein
MGTNGTTPGAAITPIGAEFYDEYNPDWHTDSQVAAVKNYIPNDDDPTRFYVYPPNTGTGYVEGIYSALPADVVAGAGPVYTVAINLSDIYQDALRNYILFRCYAKDAALSPQNEKRALDHFNLFVQGLGRMDLVRKVISPNMHTRNPSTEENR